MKYLSNGSILSRPIHLQESGGISLASRDGGEVVKLAIAGDWGTGTNEAYRVAAGISAFTPDYTIHLGDVYYVW